MEQGHRPIICMKLVQQDTPIHDANRRSPLFINTYPEKEKLQVNLKRTVPRNTTYSDFINKGRKVKFIGTSMMKDIRNKEFNFHL